MKSRSANPVHTPARLRIIAGRWRGRKLPIPDIQGLRPTGDRVRETLFNWLAPDLTGAHCLDLFTGSGALGLEALSRGASAVTLVELERRAAEQLRVNCATLGTRDGHVIEANAITWLRQYSGQPFDVIFLDPPFAADLWQSALEALEASGAAADQASIYVETPRDHALTAPQNWMLHRRKAMGAVCAHLFIRNASGETSAPQGR